jgi:3-oxoacyl-[acyl-carrier protein] reductase
MNGESSRVVLVTGAAGGLGRAVVEELARNGDQVLAGWHSKPLENLPPNASPVALDVTSDEQCRAAIDLALERHGRIDAVIHCGGVAHNALLARLADEDWDRTFRVNLDGAMRIARAALRPMIRQRSGHIVQIGSLAGVTGAAGRIPYAASKAAVHGLTQSLAREVGGRNVRVNTVIPGAMMTAMVADLGPEHVAKFIADNALGRLNDPAEVARFIAFLIGTQNISGQLFNLDSRIHS